MKTLAILVLLTTAASAAPAAPSKKQLEIDRHEWMAQYYLRRANDLAGAAKEYKAILAIDAANDKAALALASIYVADKKEKLAVDVLARLTKKNPKNADAWLTLGQLAARAGDDKAMKTDVQHALDVDPSNVEAYGLLFERAQQRVRGGDADGKADVLDAARKLMLFTRREGPIYKLAERAVVELSGDPIALTVYDAKRSYNAAFENGMLGDINAKMATARRGFQECTKAQPQNEECHYLLGLVYSSVKASDAYDPKAALAEFSLAPGKPLAFVESARILRAQDKLPEARAALEKAIALDKRLAVAHVELGILDKLAGKTDAAVEDFVAAMDIDPYGDIGDRALGELTKVRPTHPRVTEGMIEGKRGGDVFSSERFKSVVALIEKELGGVEPDAPERPILDEIVQRLADGSAVKQQFHVQVVASTSVNAFALGDGRVYVTRGLLDLLKKKFPGRPIDANNDVLGHVLGHELQHVIRRHILNTVVFQEAIKDASRPLDPAVLTHVTRLHEIDADREGMVMAFLAGYHPRGGIEFMEAMGQDLEIPQHLDHPTFQERIEYLTEYWTNDVRYAFVSFKLGVAAMDKGAKLEATDMKAAIGAYEEAVDDFKRFHAMLPSLKEASNDLGVAYTKLGVLAMSAGDSPLGRWQTRFSLERESAVKYVGLAREEGPGGTRGATAKDRIPWQLREAIAAFKEALQADETYAKARINLAAAYLAANQLDNAQAMLGKVEPKGDVTPGDVALIQGIVSAEGKDFDRAVTQFTAAVGSQSAKRAATYNLARALELANRKPEAKKAYQTYSKSYPGGPWAKAADAAAAKL